MSRSQKQRCQSRAFDTFKEYLVSIGCYNLLKAIEDLVAFYYDGTLTDESKDIFNHINANEKGDSVVAESLKAKELSTTPTGGRKMTEEEIRNNFIEQINKFNEEINQLMAKGQIKEAYLLVNSGWNLCDSLGQMYRSLAHSLEYEVVNHKEGCCCHIPTI